MTAGQKVYRQEEEINGSYGEVWFDEEYLGSLTKFKATENYTYADVKRPRKITVGKKLIQRDGSIEIEIGKTSSVGIRHYQSKIKEGKQPVLQIMGKLDDPDSIGTERAMFNNCVPQSLDIFDFEAAAAGKEKLQLFFEDWEPYDFIED